VICFTLAVTVWTNPSSIYIKRTYNLVIGQKTAKSLKEILGSGIAGRTDSMVVVGRDVVSGLPIEMEVTADVIYEAIKDNLASICNSIKMILEKTPPELAKGYHPLWNLHYRWRIFDSRCRYLIPGDYRYSD